MNKSGRPGFLGAIDHRQSYLNIVYLLLGLPLGIVSYTIAVTLIAVTFGFLGAPYYYWVDDGLGIGSWQVNRLWEALTLTLAGISMVFISLYIMNVTAFQSGRLAKVMLGKLS